MGGVEIGWVTRNVAWLRPSNWKGQGVPLGTFLPLSVAQKAAQEEREKTRKRKKRDPYEPQESVLNEQ